MPKMYSNKIEELAREAAFKAMTCEGTTCTWHEMVNSLENQECLPEGVILWYPYEASSAGQLLYVLDQLTDSFLNFYHECEGKMFMTDAPKTENWQPKLGETVRIKKPDSKLSNRLAWVSDMDYLHNSLAKIISITTESRGIIVELQDIYYEFVPDWLEPVQEGEAQGMPEANTTTPWIPKVGDVVVTKSGNSVLATGTAYRVARVVGADVALHGLSEFYFNAVRYFRPATPLEADAFNQAESRVAESATVSTPKVHDVVMCLEEDGGEAIYVDGWLDRSDSTLYCVAIAEVCKDKIVRLSHRELGYSLDKWPTTLAELDKWLQEREQETKAEQQKAAYRDIREDDIGKYVETWTPGDPAESWFDAKLLHILPDGTERFVMENPDDDTRYVTSHARILVEPEPRLSKPQPAVPEFEYWEPVAEDLQHGPIAAEFSDNNAEWTSSSESKLVAVVSSTHGIGRFVELRKTSPPEFYSWKFCRIRLENAPKTYVGNKPSWVD